MPRRPRHDLLFAAVDVPARGSTLSIHPASGAERDFRDDGNEIILNARGRHAGLAPTGHDQGRAVIVARWSMLRKSGNGFSHKACSKRLESITFSALGRCRPNAA
ncbi:hypothetical protein AB4099_31220 [Bosea sp. 2KB_26]|uniref:hypothetical protein n=1 Tax=Bosea sp. 2KB_26 TaxID=3237475 RepID=UPI0013B041C4